MSFFYRMFLTVLLGFTLILLMLMLYARFSLQGEMLQEISAHTLSEARIIAYLFNNIPNTDTKQISKLREDKNRLSLFNAAGDLKDDSVIESNDFSPVHNDADRAELQQALKNGEGTYIYYDEIAKCHVVFAAVRLNNGDIIRISTLSTGYMPFLSVKPHMLGIIILLCVTLAFTLAYLLARYLRQDITQIVNIISGVAKGSYHRRLNNLSNKDFDSLATEINYMTAQIEEHIRTTAEQKEQLQSILDTMNEGVLVLGPNGSIRRFNQALSTMFPTVVKAEGRQIMEAIPAPSLQKAIEDIVKIPWQERSNINIGPLQLELGQERVFSVQLTRAGQDNLNFGAVAVFHDITSIIRLERVRRDFVANVSHELRTPLTAIQGYAETLTELDNMPNNCRRFAEIIHKNGTYLGRMVEELLALARLENDDVPMQVMTTSALESIKSAMALCRRQFELQNIQLAIEVDERLNVMASAQHLAQIFRNLLENAARYAPKASTVLLKAWPDATDKCMTCFAVCDKGPGIPVQDQDRIFERFYRVEKHRSHASTGLGLAICKHTVERLGGRIWVESPTKEYATVFYFTIPTAHGDAK